MCVQRGIPLPTKIANSPVLLAGLEIYYRAFLDLTTCRNSGGMSEGPIRWDSVVTWCQFYGLSKEQSEDLIYFIGKMDSAYLKYKDDQSEKAKRDGKSRPVRRNR